MGRFLFTISEKSYFVGGKIMIRVAVSGAFGRMGREVSKAVFQDEKLELVAAVDITGAGERIASLIDVQGCDIVVESNLNAALLSSRAQVLVDFTQPKSAMGNIQTALKNGVIPVVGTTGIGPDEIAIITEWCSDLKGTCLLCPNFSIGAVLMMKFAEETARYMNHCEIIELHHDQKLDAPSGTAMRTAQMVAAVRGSMKQGHPDEEEKLIGARGADFEGIRIHSVRLPGYVAHQEVIFGGLGQTLTFRHDSISRECFMPGVVLACEKIIEHNGLVIGLDILMGL